MNFRAKEAPSRDAQSTDPRSRSAHRSNKARLMQGSLPDLVAEREISGLFGQRLRPPLPLGADEKIRSTGCIGE
jgi:hypothetical protein